MTTERSPRIPHLLPSTLCVIGLAIGLAFPLLSAPPVYGQGSTEDPSDFFVYLPLVLKSFPFTPDAPALDAISNEDGEGDYTVSWSASEGAETYTLEEAADAGFSSPNIVYSGPNTSTAISGRDVGTYYYRVRASNPYASSDWSNTQSVEVTVPLPDCPQEGEWFGITSQGYPISFVVEHSPECQIADGSLWIKHVDNCGTRTVIFSFSIPITDNRFTAGYSNNGVKGTFSSSSTAEGTFAFEYLDPSEPWRTCSSSGTWTAPTNAANDHVYVLAVQTDGKVLLGGDFTALGGQRYHRIARLHPDGTLDAAFKPVANGRVSALVVQADGKIVVGGSFTELNDQPRDRIARLNPDGSLDTTFNPGADSRVTALAVQEDGKIVVGGWFNELAGQTRNRIGRLNSDGTLDAAFNPGADDRVRTLTVQTDGKVVVGGSFTELNGQPRDRIARLNPDGTLDAAFDVGVDSPGGWVSALALQPDGSILVGGSFTKVGGQTRDRIARLNPDGTLDTSFDPGANLEVSVLALQPDGKILVGGWFWEIGEETRSHIARLNPDGTLDASFNPGANNNVFALAVQADGRIMIGGWFTRLGGELRSYIGRLNPDGTLDDPIP